MTGLMPVIGFPSLHRNGRGMSDVIATAPKFVRKERSFMKRCKFILSTMLILTISMPAVAHCPLDHLIIGCNENDIEGTDDDKKLFVNCGQKYRHSGLDAQSNWYYPLHKSIFPDYSYRLGEPGFDAFQNHNPNENHTYDPNRCLIGNPNEDYRIIVECISISPGLRVKHKDYPQFTIDEVGEHFNHSYIHKLRGEPHIHLSYQALDGENLYWVTFFVYDEPSDPNDPNHYQPSEPFTIVFNREPLAGDLLVDGTVDAKDLTEFSYYWLSQNSSIHNDYYERADSNRDGSVDLADFSLLASNWLQSLSHTEEKNSSN